MKRLKKGFSLVEGVIALAVIVIISAAATSLCIYGANTTPKLYAKFQASNIAADVVTCFDMACEEDSANQSSTFGNYLNFYVYGDSNKSDGIIGTTTDNKTTYNFSIDNVTADVTANFTTKEVTITTYFNSSTSVLYSYEYTAGSNQGGV